MLLLRCDGREIEDFGRNTSIGGKDKCAICESSKPLDSSVSTTSQMSIASAFEFKRPTILPLIALVGLTLVAQLGSVAATYDGNFLFVFRAKCFRFVCRHDSAGGVRFDARTNDRTCLAFGH